jgi:fatty-acyl-CoA synthase
MYTSGTTDRPKGVMHSYENYHWKCLDHISVLGLTARPPARGGPLYHVGAFDLPGLAAAAGGRLLAVLRDFEEATLALIEQRAPDRVWMAPVMLNRLLACPRGATSTCPACAG